MTETWKQIVLYRNGEKLEFDYDVSTFGNVRSQKTKLLLKPHVKNDISMVSFRIKRKGYNCTVHQLVAQMFLENPNNYTIVNHLNHNKSDNRLENLAWVSSKENALHAHAKKDRKTNAKSINQYNLNGEFIKKFDSIRQAATELNIPEKQFNANLTEQRKEIEGFTFKYEEPRVVMTEEDLSHFESIINHPNYLISRDGQVYSTRFKKIMKPLVQCGDYIYLQLDSQNLSIHSLVANQFIPNPDNCLTVNHKDGNKKNNHVDNLEWASHSDQITHAIYSGINPCTRSVDQFTLNGEFIQHFDSIANALRHLNKLPKYASNLTLSCNNANKTAYGYKWKYSE